MALLAVIALYALFIAIGWRAARKVQGGSALDLIVAGRSMPLWIATVTMTATWVDGGYLLGTTEGAFKSSIASSIQGGVCFGISLILGGLFFARKMREYEFTTLIDLFEARFGKKWAAILFIPAVLAEVFWSAELLVAIGATFGVVLGLNLTTAILFSALAVTLYTMLGGMWSVAYTDAVQLGLVALGLAIALPIVLQATGGLESTWAGYIAARPDRGIFFPPLQPNGSYWTMPAIVGWWDVSFMLMLGGIPWNCYFQRVLSCKSPRHAQAHSLLAGMLTIAFTLPPLLLGIAAFQYRWPLPALTQLQLNPSQTLPMILQHLTPPVVGLLGLGAIIGAVTSSYSASILSAAAMFAWNCWHRLLHPDLTGQQLRRLIRIVIGLLGGLSVLLALKVQSVQALWFFTSDLVFVLLFPQLVFALFDPKANLYGSITAFGVSFLLRLGGGEPLFHLPGLIPYPEIFHYFIAGDPKSWYDGNVLLFPFKSLAMVTGFILLPLVSRLTASHNPAIALPKIPASKS